MKRVGKPVFFVVVAILALLTYAAFFGVSSKYGDIDRTYIKGADDIRWGIDIRGGVDVTFSPPEGVDATDEEMSAAESVIKTRLLNRTSPTVRFTPIQTLTVLLFVSHGNPTSRTLIRKQQLKSLVKQLSLHFTRMYRSTRQQVCSVQMQENLY